MSSIAEHMETLRRAREAEANVREQLESALEERDDFVRSFGAKGLNLIERIDQLTLDKNEAKAITKDAYDNTRDTALLIAEQLLREEKVPWGRGLHRNLQVQ